MSYCIGLDQSTQGTKALLFDKDGKIIAKAEKSHKQIIDEHGFVEHDPQEIYKNTVHVIKEIVENSKIDKNAVKTIGICNQRETSVCWNKDGSPAYNAIVWQCSRGTAICEELEKEDENFPKLVQERTGLKYSPFFSAAKIAWVLKNVENIDTNKLCCGTIDSYLLYRLTDGKSFKTDYSNASRTQLFNIKTLKWDEEICSRFGIPVSTLPQVCDSNAMFGTTTLGGYFDNEVTINSIMGDSHAALYGQGCTETGMIKATYGTGSSVMMNIGEKLIFSDSGIVTSIGFAIDGKISYVLENNINYSGAVITWLKDDLQLIDEPNQAGICAQKANPADSTYLVPAFTGLGAPYWDNHAKAVLCGMTRTTGKNEICRAALDSIAYQINDALSLMSSDSKIKIKELRVDGGPTKSDYLMKFQSNIAQLKVAIPDVQELSAIGTAYLAGITAGMYKKEELEKHISRKYYEADIDLSVREEKINGWNKAVKMTIGK